jgi:hypothetical protein
MLIVLSCLLLGGSQALETMEANRRALTGVIEWTLAQPGGLEFQYISRYANNGDYVFENRGTVDGGWTEFGMHGPTSRMPQLYMKTALGFWTYQETSFGANVYEPGYEEAQGHFRYDGPVRDFRVLGLLPFRDSFLDPGGRALDELGKLNALAWDERKVGDVVVVTAQLPYENSITWELDPVRDWNPRRVYRKRGDRIAFEAVSDLKQFGDVWLPASVEYLAAGEVMTRITVRKADVSRGRGPASFNPNDLKIEPGVNIDVYNRRGEVTHLAWTGTELMPLFQFFEEVREGKRPKHTIFERYSRNGRYAGPYLMPGEKAMLDLQYNRTRQDQQLRAHEQIWERYVREFIARFELDAEQTAATWRMHQACVEQAREHLERNNKRMVDALTRLEQAREARDEGKLAAAKANWEELTSPIQRIFEQQLKPRLEKIPTRAQRAAAEQKDRAAPAPAEARKP